MINTFSGRWRFLSNFYPVKIEYRGISYPSVEHFYVSMKIKDDQYINNKFITKNDCQEMISKIPSASEVKRIGRTLKVRKDWDNVKYKIMEWAVNEKFKDPDLRRMLLETGSEDLIEGNWWHDNYWGVCTCEKCNNKGENNLGKILMSIRKDITFQKNII